MWRRGVIYGITAALLMFSGAFAGTIKGKIGAKRAKYMRNVVVYIDAIPGKTFAAPAKHAEMDQKDLVFIPHVLPVLEGTTVDFLNGDNVLHNVFTPSKAADKFNLGTWPKGEKRSYTFKKVGSAVLLCNVHPEMEAYVVVTPTPYYAVTDEAGNYTIEGVPAGTYTLKAWTEKRKLKTQPQQITVSATGVVQADFTLKR